MFKVLNLKNKIKNKNLFIAGTAKSGLVGGAEEDGSGFLTHIAKSSHFL
jgi:hypothetical protein